MLPGMHTSPETRYYFFRMEEDISYSDNGKDPETVSSSVLAGQLSKCVSPGFERRLLLSFNRIPVQRLGYLAHILIVTSGL